MNNNNNQSKNKSLSSRRRITQFGPTRPRNTSTPSTPFLRIVLTRKGLKLHLAWHTSCYFIKPHAPNPAQYWNWKKERRTLFLCTDGLQSLVKHLRSSPCISERHQKPRRYLHHDCCREDSTVFKGIDLKLNTRLIPYCLQYPKDGPLLPSPGIILSVGICMDFCGSVGSNRRTDAISAWLLTQAKSSEN